MKKVFQSKVFKDKGDCARAVLASLFELKLEDVPDFRLNHEKKNMNHEIMKWFSVKGYDPCYIRRDRRKNKKPTLQEVAKHDGGINGYFYASVPSQTFKGVTHAVVVDTDLNIIHDPNPNQKALLLKPKDVIDILVVTDFVIMPDGTFKTTEEWRGDIN